MSDDVFICVMCRFVELNVQ